jgi:hypothetical protein
LTPRATFESGTNQKFCARKHQDRIFQTYWIFTD